MNFLRTICYLVVHNDLCALKFRLLLPTIHVHLLYGYLFARWILQIKELRDDSMTCIAHFNEHRTLFACTMFTCLQINYVEFNLDYFQVANCNQLVCLRSYLIDNKGFTTKPFILRCLFDCKALVKTIYHIVTMPFFTQLIALGT